MNKARLTSRLKKSRSARPRNSHSEIWRQTPGSIAAKVISQLLSASERSHH